MPATTSIPWARRCCRWGWWGRIRPARRSGARWSSGASRPTGSFRSRATHSGQDSDSRRRMGVPVRPAADRPGGPRAGGRDPARRRDVARRAASWLGRPRGRRGPVGLRLRHGHAARPGRDPGARRARGHRDGRLAVRPPPVRAAHRGDAERVGGRAHPGNVARRRQGRGASGLAAPRAARRRAACSSPAGRRGWPCSSATATATFVPIFGSDEIADVTGAGDTVISTFTLALASGARPVDAARLANYAGGLVVMKRGTATVSAGRAGRGRAPRPGRRDA